MLSYYFVLSDVNRLVGRSLVAVDLIIYTILTSKTNKPQLFYIDYAKRTVRPLFKLFCIFILMHARLFVTILDV